MPQYLVTCVVNSLCYGAADVRDGMTGGGVGVGGEAELFALE